MTSIKISNHLSTTSTPINNTFIDYFMPPANGEFVKVYLYLLRTALCGLSPTISDMADALNNTESDVTRALKYWEKQGLLILHFNAVKDVEFIELLPIREPDKTPAPVVNIAPVVNMPPKKPNYSIKEIANAFTSPEMEHLSYEAEVLLGQQISPENLQTLYYIYDQLNFSVDLISYLIEYCVTIGKKSFQYIEKVAISWHEQGIKNRGQAKSATENFNKLNSSIKKALGLVTWGEEAGRFAKLWTEEYQMDSDLIIEACNRAYKRTSGENSLSYTAAILKNWHEQGIKDLNSLKKADSDFKEKSQKIYTKNTKNIKTTSFHNFEQGEDIDYDAILPKVATTLRPGNKI